MKKRNSIEIFSTSAIDLLACGLALAAVLWVLEMPNNGLAGEGESSHFDAFLRIQQFGIFHFQGIEINGNGINWKANYNSWDNVFVQQNIEGFKSDITKGPTIPLTVTNPDNTLAQVTVSVRKSELFAGEMSVRFEGVVGDLNVQFRVRPCMMNNEVHYLELFKVDRTGISRPQYLWQCENELESALNQRFSSATPKWLKAYHKGLNGNSTSLHRSNMEIHTWNGNECFHGQNLSIKLTGDGRLVQQTYNNSSRELDNSEFWKKLEDFAKRPIK
jgi:hypothetical protein